MLYHSHRGYTVPQPLLHGMEQSGNYIGGGLGELNLIVVETALALL
jgi:hypothetical protein